MGTVASELEVLDTLRVVPNLVRHSMDTCMSSQMSIHAHPPPRWHEPGAARLFWGGIFLRHTGNLEVRRGIFLGPRLESPHAKDEQVELVREVGLQVSDLSAKREGAWLPRKLFRLRVMRVRRARTGLTIWARCCGDSGDSDVLGAHSDDSSDN